MSPERFTFSVTGKSVSLYSPSGSVTRSMTSFEPRSVDVGRPLRFPPLSIESQAGPLNRVNIRSLTSLSGSNTSSVRDLENKLPTTASPRDHRAAIHDGR